MVVVVSLLPGVIVTWPLPSLGALAVPGSPPGVGPCCAAASTLEKPTTARPETVQTTQSPVLIAFLEARLARPPNHSGSPAEREHACSYPPVFHQFFARAS